MTPLFALTRGALVTVAFLPLGIVLHYILPRRYTL